MDDPFKYGLLAGLAIALLVAAFTDLRSRHIGNWLNGGIALGAPLFWWANGLSLWPDIALQIGVTIASAVPLTPQVKAGKLRALGVTGPKRSVAFPDVPAIAETLPGYEVVNWFGVLAPAGTPKAIVSRLNTVLDKALESPELVKMLNARTAEAERARALTFYSAVPLDHLPRRVSDRHDRAQERGAAGDG
mgnify:CR=1 FL=1